MRSESKFRKDLSFFCRKVTQYLIVVDGSKLEMSNKYQYIQTKMRPENRPHIVSLDWMLDCMENGAIVDATDSKYRAKSQ